VEWHGESSPSQTFVCNAKLFSCNPTAKAEWLQRSGHTTITIQAMSVFPWMVKDSLHTVTQSQTDIGDDRAGCWQEGNISFQRIVAVLSFQWIGVNESAATKKTAVVFVTHPTLCRNLVDRPEYVPGPAYLFHDC